jgi:hypothetical protein
VVSKSIANLERVLGVRLLDRSPQRMELTAFGHTLLKRSASVIWGPSTKYTLVTTHTPRLLMCFGM